LQMAPMIDIVFNLVVFFVLMPSFEAGDGFLPTNLPSGLGGRGGMPRTRGGGWNCITWNHGLIAGARHGSYSAASRCQIMAN